MARTASSSLRVSSTQVPGVCGELLILGKSVIRQTQADYLMVSAATIAPAEIAITAQNRTIVNVDHDDCLTVTTTRGLC